MLARQQVFLDLDNPSEEYADSIEEDERETLAQLMSNVCSITEEM
jgi:hypothetical protein